MTSSQESEGFKYDTPAFIQVNHPALKEALETIEHTVFYTNQVGRIILPPELKKYAVQIGNSTYRLGIGGLHSSEQNTTHTSNDDHQLYDFDVVSYYPAIIIKLKLFPESAGPGFVKVFKEYVDMRVNAKKSGDDVTAAALKIAINGVYGKFGSKWSFLYAPQNIIQVTITGQLCLLMLIEALESEGIPVVSANTDGIVIKCPDDKYDMMYFIVDEWETITEFETESTRYKSLHSRDVNNYIAIKDDGYKSKGAFSTPGLMKNPETSICNQAVINYLIDGKPLQDTIQECKDVTQFVSVRTVRDGALDQHGDYLGKVIRWYYAKGIKGPITHSINGYKVPKSEGAQALMDLPDQFPKDINYDWYLGEAQSLLTDLGVLIDETEGTIH
tara:strand:+ start:129 stop:1289 length:1161 start_codon:yes stop_codon:yes gene_type:complete